MVDILSMGELLAEIMAEQVGQTFTEPGVFLGPYPSGAPAIFADQAAKTGASVAFIGCAGQDGFGDLIVDRLRHDGVDVSGIRRTDSLPTGTAFVTYQRDGGRQFIFNIANSAAALIDADFVDAGLAGDCRYLHIMGSSLGSPGSIAAVNRALELVEANGGQVSFDPNIRPEVLTSPVIGDAIAHVLEQCHILLPSEDDLRYFCGDMPEDEAVAALFDRHRLEMIVVKNAAEGCVYHDRARSLHVPSFEVTEVDPTGAGDCFGGTLISCLAQGLRHRARPDAGQRRGGHGGVQARTDGRQHHAGRTRPIRRIGNAIHMNSQILTDIVDANRAGSKQGIYSVCSAHDLVLEASLRQAKADGSPLLIEATCNQVNQDGGYTGMTPSDFRAYVLDIAKDVDFPEDRIVLGGDHLGPNPWTSLPAAEAMKNAKTMVAAYVSAGFAKIHLGREHGLC